MKIKRIPYLVGLILTLPWLPHCHASQPASTTSVSALPHTPADYLRRTAEMSNIRAAGSVPFHLAAQFVASGQVEFTGQGKYEETWLSPEKWERSVTLGTYHAVEEMDGPKHTLSTTNSYEPKRVLEVLDLLLPHPTAFETGKGWKVEPGRLPGGTLLISRRSSDGELSVDLFADGSLARYRQPFVEEIWGNYIHFSGKGVPRDMIVRSSMGTLLQLSVTELNAVAPASLLPAGVSGQATTVGLGPLWPGGDSLTHPKLTHSVDPKFPPGEDHEAEVWLSIVVDQAGNVREPETYYATEAAYVNQSLKVVSEYRFKPATLQGTAVEVPANVVIMYRKY